MPSTQRERFFAVFEGGTPDPSHPDFVMITQTDPIFALEALTEILAPEDPSNLPPEALTDRAKTFAALYVIQHCSTERNCFFQCSTQLQATVRERLLRCFTDKKTHLQIRNRAGQAVAIIALQSAVNHRIDWKELWPVLEEMSEGGSGNEEDDKWNLKLGVLCSAAIVGDLTPCFVSPTAVLRARLETTCYKVLRNCLEFGTKHDDEDVLARVFAVIFGLAANLNSNDVTKLTSTFLSDVLKATRTVCSKGNDGLAAALFAALETGAEETPAFFRPSLAESLQTGLDALVGEENATSSIGLEAQPHCVNFLIALCKSEKKQLTKKAPKFLERYITVLFKLAMKTTVESAAEWDEEFETDDDQTDLALAALDNLSQALGGKKVLPLVQPLVAHHISDEDNWKNQFAALKVMAVTIEGCKEQVAANLDSTMSIAEPLCKNENKYVRHAALQLVGQMCTDLAPAFNIEYHRTIVPLFCDCLDDPIPKIRALGGQALYSFFEGIEDVPDKKKKAVLPPARITAVTKALVKCLSDANSVRRYLFATEKVLEAASNLIECCGERMTAHLGELMSLFNKLLSEVLVVSSLPLSDNNKDKSDSELLASCQCRVVECVTLLADAVGYENFQGHAEAVCSFLMRETQQLQRERREKGGEVDCNNPKVLYIFRGWSCMVSCVGEKIVPLLPDILPPIIATADLECEVEILGNRDELDEDDLESLAEEEGTELCEVSVPGQGAKKVLKIKTATIDAKDTSLTVLYRFTDELKGKMIAHLPELVPVLLRCLKFALRPDIRTTAAMALTSCFKALDDAGKAETGGVELWSVAAPQLLEALESESFHKTTLDILEAFIEAIKALPTDTLRKEGNEELLHKLMIYSHKVLSSDEDDYEESDDEEEDDDDDDEEGSSSKAHERWEELLGQAVELTEAILQKHSTFHHVFVSDYFPIVHSLIGDDSPVRKKFGICLLDSFLEFAPRSAVMPYLSDIAATFLNLSNPETMLEEEDLCQAVCYGCGFAAEIIGKHFSTAAMVPKDVAHYLKSAVSNLVAFLESDELDVEESHAEAVCNCVGALLKHLQHFAKNENVFGQESGVQHVWSVLFNYLPVPGDDLDESDKIYKRLVEWIETKSPVVEDYPKVRHKLVSVLRKVEEDDVDDAELFERIHKITEEEEEEEVSNLGKQKQKKGKRGGGKGK